VATAVAEAWIFPQMPSILIGEIFYQGNAQALFFAQNKTRIRDLLVPLTDSPTTTVG
jgi:hypothetical protein